MGDMDFQSVSVVEEPVGPVDLVLVHHPCLLDRLHHVPYQTPPSQPPLYIPDEDPTGVCGRGDVYGSSPCVRSPYGDDGRTQTLP